MNPRKSHWRKGAASAFHKLHRAAKRMLLVTRDYTSANPIIPAMTLGQIDYHRRVVHYVEVLSLPADGANTYIAGGVAQPVTVTTPVTLASGTVNSSFSCSRSTIFDERWHSSSM